MKRRISTISLTVALVATACTGGDAGDQALDQPLDQQAGQSIDVPTTQPLGRSVQEPSPTTIPATTTTTVLAPSTLAFSSSADVGRLFSVDRDITASTSAGGEPNASAISAGTIVQASSLRSRNDVLWVRVESTVPGESTLGWIPSDTLTPTTESIFTEDQDSVRQFRQVAAAVENDALGILAVPGTGSPIGFLAEGEIAMHGGVSALAPSGDIWLDIIDPDTSERLGWVPARFFRGLSGGAIQDSDGNNASRNPSEGVNYGQALTGGVTAAGCNAVQVTFTNASSGAGLGIVFGTDSPLGRELSSGDHNWSGTSIFGPAGSDLTITIPSRTTRSWFFAPLNNDGQAAFSVVDENGFAVASDVTEISIPAGTCVPEPRALANEVYLEGLSDEERAEALAAFNGELTGTEGDQPPLIPGAESELADGTQAAAEAADGTQDAAVDPAAADPAADPAATDPAAVDPAAADPAVVDPAADPAATDPAAVDPAAGTAEQPAE